MKVTLLFSPMSEARLFPYGSLPALAGFLREKGYEVACHDINLALTKRLCSDQSISAYRTELMGRKTLKGAVRLAFLDYFETNKQAIRNSVWGEGDRQTALSSKITPIRMIHNLVESITEGSFLRTKIRKFGDFDYLLDRFFLDGWDYPTAAVADLIGEINFTDTSVVCLSVPFFSQLLPTLYISKMLKTMFPHLKILLGGPQIYLRAKDLLKLRHVRENVDGICPERGEAPLLSYLQFLKGIIPACEVAGFHLLNVPDTAFIPSEPVPMTDLPAPDFAGLDLNHYLSEEVQVGITTCYGCYWGRCAFCSYGNRTLRDGQYDQFSPEKLANICLEIKRTTGINRVNFVDENTNLKLVERASTLVRQAGMKLRFSTRNRLEPVLLRPEFVRRLKKNGLVLMSSGYETNQQVLLDRIHKGLRASTFQRIIDILYSEGIPLRLSVMSGLPGETTEMARASLAFLKHNEAKIGIDITQVMIAEPATLLIEHPEDYGLSINSGLLGNDRLNFGQGRVGAAYKLADTIGFQEAEAHLVEMHRQVSPQMNDERAPDKDHIRTHMSSQIQEETKLKRFYLNDWVTIIADPTGTDRILYDAAWQNVIRLEQGIQVRNRTLFIEPSSDKERKMMNRVLTMNLARVE